MTFGMKNTSADGLLIRTKSACLASWMIESEKQNAVSISKSVNDYVVKGE
jgi:hypothetical protein